MIARLPFYFSDSVLPLEETTTTTAAATLFCWLFHVLPVLFSLLALAAKPVSPSFPAIALFSGNTRKANVAASLLYAGVPHRRQQGLATSRDWKPSLLLSLKTSHCRTWTWPFRFILRRPYFHASSKPPLTYLSILQPLRPMTPTSPSPLPSQLWTLLYLAPSHLEPEENYTTTGRSVTAYLERTRMMEWEGVDRSRPRIR